MRFLKNLFFIAAIQMAAQVAVMPASMSFAAENNTIPFPDGFWWGTSLAAHQAEGGNHNSWTQWEDIPGKIKTGEKSGLASDHWNRFEEDFQSLVWLGANTHRFSIEWS